MKKHTFKILDPENDIWWEGKDLYIRDSEGRVWQFNNAYFKHIETELEDGQVVGREISIREMGIDIQPVSVSKEDYDEFEKRLEISAPSRFSISAKHDGALLHAETRFQNITFSESDGSEMNAKFRNWVNSTMAVEEDDG